MLYISERSADSVGLSVLRLQAVILITIVLVEPRLHMCLPQTNDVLLGVSAMKLVSDPSVQ